MVSGYHTRGCGKAIKKYLSIRLTIDSRVRSACCQPGSSAGAGGGFAAARLAARPELGAEGATARLSAPGAGARMPGYTPGIRAHPAPEPAGKLGRQSRGHTLPSWRRPLPYRDGREGGRAQPRAPAARARPDPPYPSGPFHPLAYPRPSRSRVIPTPVVNFWEFKHPRRNGNKPSSGYAGGNHQI